jgi:uncharacterized membrane protein
MEHSEAVSALDAKRQAEAQLARACNCPPWRHAVFGLLFGALIAGPAFPFAIWMAILVLILCCTALIIRSDRKRLGMFINGYRRGKTRVVAIGTLIAELALYFVSVVRALDQQDHVTPLLLGIVAIAVGIIGSLLWQRVFVRELTA